MPIEIPTSNSIPVYFPKENYEISRYLDLVKFVSMLQTNKIFFSRLDKFEDKYEGTIPTLTENELRNWYKKLTEKKLLDIINTDIDTHVEKEMLNEKFAREKFKELICVSCWNKSSSESYALWKIYSDLSKGIMIKTTVERIMEGFKSSFEQIQMSEIKYLDYKTEKIQIGNRYSPIIHKNVHYDYEKEVRLFFTVDFEEGFKYDWSKEESEFGRYIEVDTSILIEEIIISPYAPKWFFLIIENLCERYNFTKNIRYSDLK